MLTASRVVGVAMLRSFWPLLGDSQARSTARWVGFTPGSSRQLFGLGFLRKPILKDHVNQ